MWKRFADFLLRAFAREVERNGMSEHAKMLATLRSGALARARDERIAQLEAEFKRAAMKPRKE